MGGGGGLKDFSVSPSFFGTIWDFELIGTWLGRVWGVWGLRVWDQGSTNFKHKVRIMTLGLTINNLISQPFYCSSVPNHTKQ